MKPFFVLIAVFALSAIFFKITRKNWNLNFAGVMALSVMLIFSSLGHFMFPKGMAMMIPDFLPAKKTLVFATGLLEIIFAVLILFKKYCRITGLAIIIFLIAVLPTNILASVNHINYETGDYTGEGLPYLYFRIPLQMFYIVWTYLFTVKNNN